MAKLAADIGNYADDASCLAGRESRKLGNNTWVERRDDDTVAVRFHATDIVRYLRNGVTVVDNGGYNTVTTRDRINQLVDGVRVSTKRGQAYLSRRGGTVTVPYAHVFSVHYRSNGYLEKILPDM